ncbi:hypothetical protein Ga0074812_11528 [Parafrankia irregularis]|uniref:Uncharacterized protein n=1 Tax=Parafrankia irregularis TaxID=795642 RepID=A0A0S4QS40_9ACTN|nr:MULTISPECIES: hypothetical protein [Parafrankia]MBE3202642.1 hypothetical protein [Parafrankia sp. CH37]CUU57826.1 hypothetical protein Ga0074812_11528 [Parafrankia irregularis]
MITPPPKVAIRVHGQPADVADTLTKLRGLFPTALVSRPYPDRAGGRVRIFLTIPRPRPEVP